VNGPDKFKGIDIMRAVRSFDPCLPCGVHMYRECGRRWIACGPICIHTAVWQELKRFFTALAE
jgi:hypothetical protein